MNHFTTVLFMCYSTWKSHYFSRERERDNWNMLIWKFKNDHQPPWICLFQSIPHHYDSPSVMLGSCEDSKIFWNSCHRKADTAKKNAEGSLSGVFLHGCKHEFLSDLWLNPLKDKQNTISRSGLCRHGNSDMCTWLSKASDIQAPLTESHHHHHHHHSTESAAGGARSETWVCRDDSAQNGSLSWSHAKSKYNTAS